MGTDNNNMVLAFAKPSGTAFTTCPAGMQLAVSYGIEAKNAQFPNGHMFGSIATVQGTHWQFPQQWPNTAFIHKVDTTSGDKMSECVSGYPMVANGYGKFAEASSNRAARGCEC